MPSLTILFTLFMLPGICMLATSFVVAGLERKKDMLSSQH